MNNIKYTIIILVATALLSAGIGFLFGRSTIEEKAPVTTIKYVKGEKITDTIKKPVPFEVVKPIDTMSVIADCVKNGIYSELFPEKTNTEYIVITKEDTSAIIQDWGTTRLYHETLFDSDTLGTCEVNAEVQYNRLTNLSYSYLPIHKEISTITNKVKFFSPFIGAGISYSHWSNTEDWLVNANVGFFIKEKYGINLQYNNSWYFDINYIGASFIYKF